MSQKMNILLAAAFALLASATWGERVRAEEAPQGGVETSGAAAMSRRISMGVGKSMIVDLPRDVSELIVGNPKIADAVVRTRRRIYLMGGEKGQTTIIGLDSSGRQVANIEVSIGRDVGELVPLLKAAIPRSSINAKTVDDVIILTGSVASAAEAQRAVDIARGFASRGAVGGVASGANTPQGSGNVINAMVIQGEDQVMLKVTVAEVDRKVVKQLGFSAQSGGNALLRGGWGTFTSENPFSVNPVMSKTSLLINGQNNTAATLSAFERYGVTRVLAEPTLTAVSGEQAKMIVGGEIAVPASGTCSIIGAGQICTPGIAFKPYGVSLNFVPTALSEGRISLRVAAEVTEVDLQNSYSYANVSVPGFKSRKNETTVELPSGASIATAGLLGQNSTQAISGLPGLLNLPILGALFRSRDYQRNETELLVIVTPYIVRPLSQQEIARPDDGFADASDPQGWLLGRVNRIYATRSNPQLPRNFKGRIGFIHD